MTAVIHDDEDFDFATGAEEAKAEAIKNRPVYADREITPTFLTFTKEDPEHIVRFLDDDKRGPTDRRRNLWIGVHEHSFVKVVEQPASFTSDNWPTANGKGGMCRRTKPFNTKYDDCYICDQQLPKTKGKGEFAAASQRIFCRVVLREKVLWKATDEDLPSEDKIGRPRGLRDQMEEVPEVDENGKPTGQKIMAPKVRIIAASQKNFYQHLVGQAQSRYDDDGEYTVLHCDWKIKRTGFGAQDTGYTITMQPGSDRIPLPPEMATEQYPYLDVNNPNVQEYYESLIPWSLRKWIAQQASDEHFERWFVPGGWDKWEAKREEERKGEKGEQAEAKPAPKAAAKPAPAPVEQPNFDDEEDAASAAAGDPSDNEDVSAAPPVTEAPATPARQKLSGMRERMAAGPAPARERQDSSATEDQFEDA